MDSEEQDRGAYQSGLFLFDLFRKDLTSMTQEEIIETFTQGLEDRTTKNFIQTYFDNSVNITNIKPKFMRSIFIPGVPLTIDRVPYPVAWDDYNETIWELHE